MGTRPSGAAGAEKVGGELGIIPLTLRTLDCDKSAGDQVTHILVSILNFLF